MTDFRYIPVPKPQDDLVFSFDIGIASVGWAVFRGDTLIAQGVRLFKSAEEASAFRKLRGARRGNTREHWRLQQLKDLFSDFGLIDKAELEQKDYALFEANTDTLYRPEDKSIYHLTDRAIREEVSTREMFLCLYSIAHHRGHFNMDHIDFSKDSFTFEEFKGLFYDTVEPFLTIPDGSKEAFEEQILHVLFDQKIKSKEIRNKCKEADLGLDADQKKTMTALMALICGYSAKVADISVDLPFESKTVSVDAIADADDCDDFFIACADLHDYIIVHRLLSEYDYICQASIAGIDSYYEALSHGRRSAEFGAKLKEIKAVSHHKANHLRSVRNFDNKAYPNGLYIEEAKAILRKQQEYNPQITDEFIDICLSILSAKIPYYIGPLGPNATNGWAKKSGNFKYSYAYSMNQESKPVDELKSVEAWKNRMISRCTYLPDERALPKGSFIGETFSIVNELNVLNAVDQDGNDYFLSREDKIKLFDQLILKGGKAKWAKIAGLLNLSSFGSRENSSDKKSLNNGYTLYTKIIRRMPELKLDSITELFTNSEKIAKIESIVLALNLYDGKKTKYDYFINEMKLPEETAKALSALNAKSFYSLSGKFLMDTPMDQKGHTLMELLFDDNTADFTNELMTRVTYATDSDGNQVYFAANKYEKKIRENGERMDINLLIDKGRNVIPISRPVIRGLNETMKVYGRMLEKYGVPSRVIVETARDLKDHTVMEEQEEAKGYGKTSVDRMKSLYDYLDTKRSKCSEAKKTTLEPWKQLKAKYARYPLKVELYIRQNGLDLITGKPIDLTALNEYEVDHILPAGFGDDSKEDKMLIHRNTNAVKGDRLPLQYIKDGCFVDGREIGEKEFCDRVEMLYDMKMISEQKRKLLLLKTPKDLEGFVNQNLSDTRYIIREFMSILRAYNRVKGFDTHIVALKSAYTSLYRRAFNMEKNRQFGDQHHAHDAALLVVADRTLSYYYPHYDERKPGSRYGHKTYDDLIKNILDHDPKKQVDLKFFLRNAFLKAYGVDYSAPESVISQIKRTVPYISTRKDDNVSFFNASLNKKSTFNEKNPLAILGVSKKDRVYSDVGCVAIDFYKVTKKNGKKEYIAIHIAIHIPAVIVKPDGTIDEEKYIRLIKEHYHKGNLLIDKNGKLRTEFFRFRAFKNDLIYNTADNCLMVLKGGSIANKKLKFGFVNMFSYDAIYRTGSEYAVDLICKENLKTRMNPDGKPFSKVNKKACVAYIAEKYWDISPEDQRVKTVVKRVSKARNIYDLANQLAYYGLTINRPNTPSGLDDPIKGMRYSSLVKNPDAEYVKIKSDYLGVRFQPRDGAKPIIWSANGHKVIRREEFSFRL